VAGCRCKNWEELDINRVKYHKHVLRERSSELRLLVTANVVRSPPVLVTLKMEAIRSTETSFLTRATWRNIPQDDILHSRRREYLKSYISLTGWAMQQRRNVSPVKYKLCFYIP
jgi:hypothetical protein